MDDVLSQTLRRLLKADTHPGDHHHEDVIQLTAGFVLRGHLPSCAVHAAGTVRWPDRIAGALDA